MSNPTQKASEKLKETARALFNAVKWDVLARRCSEIRKCKPGTFEEGFSIVHLNLLRDIEFEDGRWTAMLRLPIKDPPFHHSYELDFAWIFDKEITAETSILVPRIYDDNMMPNNEVGAPYALMDHIDGTSANELWKPEECFDGVYGTPDQDRKFKTQMAKIQAELASHKFDKIGSLYQDDETLKFSISQDIETRTGPWVSSLDYFKELAVCAAAPTYEIQSGTIPSFFDDTISRIGLVNPEGPFGLTIRNFGAHNILVDKNFDIVGMIGCDIIAAPIEVVAQYPRRTGLDREPPGSSEEYKRTVTDIIKKQKRLQNYNSIFKEAEMKSVHHGKSTPDKKGAPIANMMWSDGASLVQGLRVYMAFRESANYRWKEGLKTLHEKYDEDIENSDPVASGPDSQSHS